MTARRALTLVELLVIVALLVVIVAVVALTLSGGNGHYRRGAKLLKDGAMMREVHASMLLFAQDHGGMLPMPGHVNRLPLVFESGSFQGDRFQDVAKNTTRHVYSCMIAQNYVVPQILVGATETNPRIVEDDDYDFTAYDPANDVYWDGDAPSGRPVPETAGFQANIEDGQSNASFAHVALAGLRKKIHWRDKATATDPIVSTRAPYRGRTSGADFERSWTLALHAPDDTWIGNICYGDNHVARAETFTPEGVTYEPPSGGLFPDNVFDMEFPDGLGEADAFLTFTRTVSGRDGHEALVDFQEERRPEQGAKP